MPEEQSLRGRVSLSATRRIVLSRDGFELAVAIRGAEMQSFIGPDGHEYLWQAGPVWPRHAPILFPAICRHPGDVLRIDNREYPLGHHGFARDLDFEVTDQGPDHLTLTLNDSPCTSRHYPFPFRLDVSYRLTKSGVLVEFRVHNPGPRTAPFGIGSHPAFKWPLDPAAAAEEHTVLFERPEPGNIRRTHDNLLLPEVFRNPSLASGQLKLGPEHFIEGAIILEALRSSALQYRSPSGRSIRLRWSGFTDLALWSPPKGRFLCIEPWRGLPAPRDWSGDEGSRPDLEHLSPKETRSYGYRIDIETP
ncbi:aldose 1-epimerase family protein [Pseudarthrobacter sp. NamE2]|uniref:aldose 1-epimerase family protein n=1 Tax=Pseudarthrobacter sp. NamE2 TaxID=2576838 RepID=UPI001485153F|nr:aldose 1-epimerase family protein [Pseudarthrobacter sp. NamE2]